MKRVIKRYPNASSYRRQRHYRLIDITDQENSVNRTLEYGEFQNLFDFALDAGDESVMTDAKENK